MDIWGIKETAGNGGEVRDGLHHLTYCPGILGTSLHYCPSHSGLLPLNTPHTQSWQTSSNARDPCRHKMSGCQGFKIQFNSFMLQSRKLKPQWLHDFLWLRR